MSNMWVGDLHIADMSRKVADMPCVGATVHWLRLRGAIDECTAEHANCRLDGKANLPRGFRLIDIARRCVVETSEVPFVALSYVWGKDTRASLLTATKNTIAALSQVSGLSIVDMPRTIEDAMNICTELGINYLWADRLCIIQDDPEDKMHQIMAMNDIYESALLVLVSAYGDSMDFGIHGVSHPRPITQHHEEISGLRITNLVRDPAESPLTLWQTRGWTYQEAVCAKRLLHFTNTRAYFECQTSTCYEDMYNVDTEINEFSTYGIHLQDENSSFEAFGRHLANYTSRKLSFSSDVYNAFVGIANLLYGSSYAESFFYGLPKVDFDRALRWYAWDGEKPVQRTEISGLVCPSWSWASAMVQEEQVRYQDTEFYGTLALWTAKGEDSEQWEVLNLHPETKLDESWEIYMVIASQEGCLRGSPIDELLRTMDNLTIQGRFRAHWPDYHSFCKTAFQTPRGPHDQDPAINKFGPGFLSTVVQTAYLRLGQRGSSHYGLGIVDLNNAVVGELCGEITNFREKALAPVNRDVLYEFFALSLSGLHIYPYTGEERTTKNYFDKDGTALETLPIVNVLLIERKGNLAYRKELGWVYLKDWAKADRRWETVVLG
ncbi:HET-domain-containing protein [Macroventuria anomochaeta]|uniref:HET-domain-containing protein n=1 Tax=Macroventuria anomochaeta TaxID=301207 RepID=A0ACB6RWL2_9PLEO|nr:HET-domain-containing protein [Macroventuria anomochaeta]KAF2625282.1 HET-domain-containing protein [Macroventuria anomochaeta]